MFSLRLRLAKYHRLTRCEPLPYETELGAIYTLLIIINYIDAETPQAAENDSNSDYKRRKSKETKETKPTLQAHTHARAQTNERT